MKICFATNNKNKLAEIKGMLEKTNIQILSLDEINCFENIPETQPTIEENSLQKAEFIYQKYKINCFSDDTGLEVKALNNEPGVFSARYAGEQSTSDQNIELLLKNMTNISNRNARFKTVISLIIEGQIQQFEGIVNGEIILERNGLGGFGYDSIFIPKGYNQTFAQMDFEQKNKISHRALAFQKLINFLHTLN